MAAPAPGFNFNKLLTHFHSLQRDDGSLEHGVVKSTEKASTINDGAFAYHSGSVQTLTEISVKAFSNENTNASNATAGSYRSPIAMNGQGKLAPISPTTTQHSRFKLMSLLDSFRTSSPSQPVDSTAPVHPGSSMQRRRVGLNRYAGDQTDVMDLPSAEDDANTDLEANRPASASNSGARPLQWSSVFEAHSPPAATGAVSIPLVPIPSRTVSPSPSPTPSPRPNLCEPSASARAGAFRLKPLVEAVLRPTRESARVSDPMLHDASTPPHNAFPLSAVQSHSLSAVQSHSGYSRHSMSRTQSQEPLVSQGGLCNDASPAAADVEMGSSLQTREDAGFHAESAERCERSEERRSLEPIAVVEAEATQSAREAATRGAPHSGHVLQVEPSVQLAQARSLPLPASSTHDAELHKYPLLFQSNVLWDCWNWLQCVFVPETLCGVSEWCRSLNPALRALIDRELHSGVILPPYARTPDRAAIQSALSHLPERAVLSLTIRKTDALRPHRVLLHPMVRVHLVDVCTGRYLPKSDKSRSVILPSESSYRVGTGSQAHVTDFILPVLSKPCNLRKIRSFNPSWMEVCLWFFDVVVFCTRCLALVAFVSSLLCWLNYAHCVLLSLSPSVCFLIFSQDILINEPLELLLSPQTLLLFEVVDFGAKVKLEKHPSGLFHVAWGFLKMLSFKGRPNLGRARIQLFDYTPPQSRPTIRRANVPDVYFDWVYQKNTRRLKYPSTLHVTLQGVATPDSRSVAQRPKLPTELETGRVPFRDMARALQLEGLAIGGAESLPPTAVASMGEYVRCPFQS